MLTDEYGTDPQITRLVNSREIWIVFDMNPDGGEALPVPVAIDRQSARSCRSHCSRLRR